MEKVFKTLEYGTGLGITVHRYYFDIGSSTIKLYKYQEELEQIKEKSILFKKNYTDRGISDENIKELIDVNFRGNL